MMTSRFEEFLLTVQKPGRYIGGEWNSVRKEWTDEKIKFLLAFPDVYEIGMSYLGMKIIYGLLNERRDCLCERVFSPWTDFENVLRKNDIALSSIESRKALSEFDIIGFSLAYELTFTNVLNILDMGKIPKRSSERGDSDPLVIAGGPSCYNPEPMAEFIDAFLIGDGEEAVVELIEMYKGERAKGPGSREKILREIAKIKGFYVPSLYDVEYNDDGTVKKFLPREGVLPGKIEKRFVKDLDSTFYPVKQIVPNIQIVHDRIAIEIMRGCKHACRFCQASATYRPCRERTKEVILKLAREAYAMTGYDEISLLSLSSADHSCIKECIEELNAFFSPKAVSISVPSLRVEGILKDIPGLVSRVRKSGLTFAPEAGSARLRKFLNKDIAIDELVKVVEESSKRGWRKVKLYFMIGLPSEAEDDIAGIVDLVRAVAEHANAVVSVNAFVPKPHTAFQREAMAGVEILESRKRFLRSALGSRRVQIDFHSFDMGYLEAVMSRGDRRLSEVIFESWKSGARFDGWQDIFDFGLWSQAFEKIGINPDFYVHRTRSPEEILPWDFIHL